MRLKGWLFPAAGFAAAAATLIVGLVIVDRLGEVAIAAQQTDSAIAARDNFTAFAAEEGMDALAAALNRRERNPAPGFRYALLDAAGRPVAGAMIPAELDGRAPGWSTVREAPGGRAWRVLSTPLSADRTLVVAENLAARDRFRSALIGAAAIALALMAAAMAAVGAVFNSLMFRRARDIAATAERIAGGDLSARTPVRPDGDVFDHLGQSLNAMLSNMEDLMVGLRTVSDSLTHDLRTPLTRMKGALARAQDDTAPVADRREALAQAAEEAEQMLATLSALTDIAHAETGLSRELMQPVDIAALVAEMAELFSPALEDAGQVLTVTAPAQGLSLPAYEPLLRQAVGNLLHNAAVHAGTGAAVSLSLALRSGRAAIVVADSGPGVPADQLGRVQERFVRLDAARSKPGSGLGLAIAAACAKLHGGRLVLEDNRPGLKVTLELPAAA